MVYRVEGMVRDTHVGGEQIRFTFDGSEQQVAAKDFDPTIQEGDWAIMAGGDNSLVRRPGEQYASFLNVIQLGPPSYRSSPKETPTLNPSRFPPDTTYHLEHDVVTIGRDAANDIVLPHTLVSRRLDALRLNKWIADGTKNLLQDISLSIYSREFVALVGPGGSGLTTLMDALSGVRPAQGTVLIDGDDLYAHHDAYRTAIGYVPHGVIIRRDLSVSAALDDAARLRLPPDTTEGERHARIAAALEEVGLTEQWDQPIHRLSGGQRTRVVLGIELLAAPSLLFLDELTSGLDPATETTIMQLLRQLANQGRTIVLITHATKKVTLCDLVIVLARGGNLAFYGPPSEVTRYFGVEYFEDLYPLLANDRQAAPEEWARRYRASAQYGTYVRDRLAGHAAAMQIGTDTVSLSWSDPGSGTPRTQHVILPATIGRGSGATVCLIDPEISREHARLERADGRVVVVDSSANGTRVNGQRAQRTVLADGDTVQIGPYRLTIDIRPALDDPPAVSPGMQWAPPPAPARPQPMRRSAAEQTAMRAAGKQIGVALLLMLLMVGLAIAVIAIVGASAHAGSSTVFVPVGGGIVIFVGFFRALLLLIVGLRNLTVALARRPR